MDDDKKSKANKLNAQHSTGPKSELGKSKSSKNAIKHGLYAVDTFLWGEDEELYKAIRVEQRKRFSPKSYVERALVDQLVAELWRLRRISRAEYLLASEIQARLKEQPADFTRLEEKLMVIYKRDPKKLEQRFDDYKARGSSKGEKSKADLITAKQIQIFQGLKLKLGEVDSTYTELFLSGQQEKMQRLIGMKRQGLQTILSIERELELRKSESA